jgi:hypothetical protein
MDCFEKPNNIYHLIMVRDETLTRDCSNSNTCIRRNLVLCWDNNAPRPRRPQLILYLYGVDGALLGLDESIVTLDLKGQSEASTPTLQLLAAVRKKV